MNLSRFTMHNRFLMLALDHRGSFRKILNPSSPESVSDQEMVMAKKHIIEALEEQFSGVLIDTEFGLPAYVSTKPYLLALEKTGYLPQGAERITQLEHSVMDLKRDGASGVKLLLYFNPAAATAPAQIETARQVLADCESMNLPFFLEIVTYDLPGRQSTSADIVRSVEIFLHEGVRPHVFKLEYPGNQASCAKISEMLGETPWILLTRGGDFDTFLSHLHEAVSQGAAGFLAGRSVWQEVGKYQGPDRIQFLRSTVKDRFSRICKTVIQSSV